MYKCEFCSRDHSGEFASGRFCSSHCSHAFTTKAKRKEINAKISAKLKGRPSTGGFKKGYDPNRKKLTSEQFKRISAIAHAARHEKRVALFATMEWEDLPESERRRQILQEQRGACTCGISTWLGRKLSLELHHINGDRNNNKRENLVVLCPNCHSLTSNFRKGHRKVYRPDDEKLRAVAGECSSIHQLLCKLGMAPKGANFCSARRWLEGLGLLQKFEK